MSSAAATDPRTDPPVDAAGAASDAGTPSARRWWVFATVSLALFMASIDQTIVSTALPTLQRDLHARVNWGAWTITVYALGQVVAMPLAGKISDLFGRKRVFLSAVALFTVASLCCGLVTNIYMLVALRGVQALGGGAFMPSATGLVADEFGRDRDRAVGLFASIFPIGGVAGPILGGVMVTYWSWRGIFLVNVPIGIVLLLVGRVLLPAGTRRAGARLDIRGVLLLATTLLSAMLGLANLGGGDALDAPAVLVPEVLALALGALFVRHTATAEAPFIPARFLAGRAFGVMNLFNFLVGAAALGFGALVPLYAQERYGVRSLEAGTLLTARAIGMMAVSGLTVYALRRTGYRRPMIVGSIVIAAGLFLLSLPPHGMSVYLWLSAAAGVTGIGMGLSVPSTNNAVLNMVPDATAAITGLRGMFRQSGAIAGVSVATAVTARAADPGLALGHVFLVFAVVVLATVPLVLLVPDHHGSW